MKNAPYKAQASYISLICIFLILEKSYIHPSEHRTDTRHYIQLYFMINTYIMCPVFSGIVDKVITNLHFQLLLSLLTDCKSYISLPASYVPQPGVPYTSAQPQPGMSYPAANPQPGMPSAPPAYSYQSQPLQPGQHGEEKKQPPPPETEAVPRMPPPAYE